MKLYIQATIILPIMFATATFLSFAGDSDLKDADSKKIVREYILYLEALEGSEKKVLSWQESLLIITGVIAVGIGASVLARIVGEVVIGEKITVSTVQEAAKRAVANTAEGAMIGAMLGGCSAMSLALPLALGAAGEGKGKEGAVKATVATVGSMAVGGVFGAVGGSWAGVLLEA